MRNSVKFLFVKIRQSSIHIPNQDFCCHILCEMELSTLNFFEAFLQMHDKVAKIRHITMHFSRSTNSPFCLSDISVMSNYIRRFSLHSGAGVGFLLTKSAEKCECIKISTHYNAPITNGKVTLLLMKLMMSLN